jgi:hypothetical protein
MPRISWFYGVLISMYWDEAGHARPHFHARYGEYKASVDFAGEIIVGSLPARAHRLVREWAVIHVAELEANWARARAEQPLLQIDPLP